MIEVLNGRDSTSPRSGTTSSTCRGIR
jgi:hypothetical protein